jgi:hypothetical protein
LAIKASEWHGTLQDLAAAGEINPDHIDDIMESAIDVGARSVFEQLPRVEALLSRRPKRKEN